MSWSWDFGDGETSTERNPTHTYASAGLYTVSLTVTTNETDDTETKPDYITVSDEPLGPSADFSGSPRSGPAGEDGLEVQFTDLSTPGTSPITTWNWTFGDGATSTESGPAHVYRRRGIYTVSLMVTTDLGIGAAVKTDYIVVSGGALGPTADFEANPESGPVGEDGLEVRFTDLSEPGASTITSWLWDFGDGATSTESDPTHVYTVAGTYTVWLMVTTSVDSDVEVKTDYVTASTGPTADFTASPRSGSVPLTVHFTDQSDPGTSSITSWLWFFGDGGQSSQRNPAHVYNAPGTYTVSLTVTTAEGSDMATWIDYITVSGAKRQPASVGTAATIDPRE
jgi:PKD repeat protein